MKYICLLSGIFLVTGFVRGNDSVGQTVYSPDKSVRFVFSSSDGSSSYSLYYNGKEYITVSQLGLVIADDPLGDMEVESQNTTAVKDTVRTVWGKFSQYDNCYGEYSCTLREAEVKKRAYKINVRVYNSGIGIRYCLVDDGRWNDTVLLAGDKTEVCFMKDHTGYSYRPEHDPDGPKPLSEFDSCLTPLTVKCDDGTHLAILEAAIFNEAQFSLKKTDKSDYSFRYNLPQSNIETGKFTSWRCVLVGDNAGDLLVSPVIYCLNPACKIEDTGWIKPGLAFWDWRAWGAKTDDGFTYGMDMASWKRFIDYASENNVRYLVLDASWYGQEFDKKSDPRTSRDYLIYQPDPDKPDLKSIPAPQDWDDPIDIPALIKYGRKRNVGVILYFNDVARYNYPFEETLALYHEWGAAGIKYGFMKGKNQQKVLDTRKIVELCAKYQLTCNFHDGPVAPSGDRRTFPNLMSREFCHSQSDALRVFGPRDFCETVFVNMVAGPLDMCNGLYTLKNPAEDRPKIFKNVNTTLVAETARVLIVFSGIAILPDCPEAYESKSDLFDFLRKLPMDYDETKILHGSIGEYITTARRSGDKWYIASATNEMKRTLDIKLDFLEPGKEYSATLYEDADDTDYISNRETYTVTNKVVTSNDTIKAAMAAGGGHCIYIEPK